VSEGFLDSLVESYMLSVLKVGLGGSMQPLSKFGEEGTKLRPWSPASPASIEILLSIKLGVEGAEANL
jgi:hypothetical protein